MERRRFLQLAAGSMFLLPVLSCSSTGTYAVDSELCNGCKVCVTRCSHGGLAMDNDVAFVTSNCAGCGDCVQSHYCPQNAIKEV